jgi:hypothetical protein
VLRRHAVKSVFCLSGGHVAPVYVAAAKHGIDVRASNPLPRIVRRPAPQVIDVRHEVNAAFAADAYARLTGTPGVGATIRGFGGSSEHLSHKETLAAIVTAGPGVTNTITALQNAKMAESPVILLGGATSTLLMGRGSLQDIDHIALLKVRRRSGACCARSTHRSTSRAWSSGALRPSLSERPCRRWRTPSTTAVRGAQSTFALILFPCLFFFSLWRSWTRVCGAANGSHMAG